MTEEQAFCLADPNGPNVSSVFLVGLGYLRAEPQITEAFRTGEGVGWHTHHDDVFVGVDAFFRPGYVAELVPNWIPALDGVHAKLTAGGRVADLGCGLGSSSVLMAQAYPRTTRAARGGHVGWLVSAVAKTARSSLVTHILVRGTSTWSETPSSASRRPASRTSRQATDVLPPMATGSTGRGRAPASTSSSHRRRTLRTRTSIGSRSLIGDR
jgi:hypothetical protein